MPSCTALQSLLFAVKMRRLRRIVARLAKIVVRLAKSGGILYPGASRTNPEANHKSVAHFYISYQIAADKFYAFFFDVYRLYV